VGALKKNTSKRVSAYGTASWAKFNRPSGTACKFAVLTQTLKPSPIRFLYGTAEAVPFVQSVFPQPVCPYEPKRNRRSLSLYLRETSVDEELGAGYVTAVVRRQEHSGFRNLVGKSQPR
jgi:hypothetical protein